MKKFIVAVCALALVAVSCKKDPQIDPIEEERVPVYEEGVYNPVMQLSSVATDGVVAETYTWDGDKLSQIIYDNGTSVNYFYNGDKLSKITANVEGDNEVRYNYSGNQLVGCEIYFGETKAIDMVMQHNATGKINAATINIDQDFLLSMGGDLFGKSSVLTSLLGRSVTEQLVKMAQLSQLDSRKFSLTNQSINIALDWDGENVSAQYLTASIDLVLNSADTALIGMFFDIPDELTAILPFIDAVGGLPANVSLKDTVSATYDQYYNPYFCNWGGLLSMDISNPNLSSLFSLNNVMTITNNGSIVVGVTFGGQTLEMYNVPIINEYNEFTYLYNEKKYPTEKNAPESKTTYTYKN